MIKVAYIGFAVPHEERWFGAGFSAAGNLAQNGFVEALKTGGILDRVWSFQPLAVWPRRKRIFSAGGCETLACGAKARLLPLINLPIVREFVRYMAVAFCLIVWSVGNIKHKRVVVIYNIFYPAAIFMRLVTWLTGVKLVPIIYELGSIGGYKIDWFHKYISKGIVEKSGFWCIPRFDGRILISDAIARDFAPGRHYVRIDGGITNMVTDRLFALTPSDSDEFRMMFAGGVNHWNHIEAMLAFMKSNPDRRIRLWVAGAGNQVPLVLDAARSDARIVYLGSLNHNELFRRYAEADCLLNLRDMSDPALAYHFPSKLLEILAIGKPVITSSTNHAKEAYGHICKVIDRIEDLGSAVGELMDMPPEERCEYGRRAREWMLVNKTWNAQGATIAKYIKETVCG